MANSLGEFLQEKRGAAGFKLREFAKMIGIAPSYLSDIENDRRVPSEEILKKVAQALGLNLSELMGLAGRMGDTVERYVRNQPLSGVLFRKIADRQLNEQQLQHLIDQTEELSVGKKKGDA